MSVLKFKCTLLSDVILNQKAATEGPNQTLDFIPGSNFLGIAASGLYKEMNDITMAIFHSGNVRFGDAHPSKYGVRGLRVPASMLYPKLSKASEELYIHHKTNHDDFGIREKQLKQCRNGYYSFSETGTVPIKTETNFAIKSAYDKDKRRSKDEQMYGYQSLQKGLELYFEVEILDETLVEDINKSLIGERKIGRSRTAQYGLVKIDRIDYKDVESRPCLGQYVEVYADGRLIFLDDYGMPTFQPTAEQLGLQGSICWEKSQIRTFQYAPWNFQRQCFDTDRCGIEKGSVFVVKTDACPEKSQYVGSYKNEGFGKVIYNPFFLNADEKGKAKVTLLDEDKKDETTVRDMSSLLTATPLLCFLNQKKKQEELEADVYERVNKWVRDNKKYFKGNTFASQWGTIRSIAIKNKSKQALLDELFDKKRDKNGKFVPDGYLTHGIAAEKWEEQGRKDRFEKFVKELTDENAQIAIINLAAEMAKRCKEEK